ncbi:MAG: outer membrane lipoprotein carrier protein LolA [Alphaproteobacteria bacterium]|nr:outer membrane lipoprotein carrier protein LolA [Alphaproteobacteria bacterium]
MFMTALMMQAATEQPVVSDAPASAETEVIAQDTGLDRANVLTGINGYLNSIDTLRARFMQISPQGQVIGGLLSIDRPGRLRFEYDDPSPISVIADGTTVAMQDRALETVDRAPIRSTPLWWLLKEEIDVEADAQIVSLISDQGLTFLIVRDPNGEMEGQIQFVFEGEDFVLREWYVTDALGQITRIILEDQETGMDLSPRLFVIPEPEDRRDSRRGRGRG